MAGTSNPAQEQVLELLRSGERPGPVEDALAGRLRSRMEDELGDLARGLAEPVFVSKRSLASVHACEAYHQAEEAAEFAWSVPAARGTVAHKAIELSFHHRGEPPPLVLVDAAIARLADDPDQSIADFLLGLDEGTRAELRSQVNDVVAKFTELWPALAPSWRPRTESSVRLELGSGKVRLRGRVDLALGTASGRVPGTLLVDLKTGAPHAGHLDDLRFYALVETLRVGVPPFRIVGYYLDAGTFDVEDVDDDVLEAALRRTTAGVRKILELRLGLRSAAVTPNPVCRWCRLRPECRQGLAWCGTSEEDDSAASPGP